MFSLESIWASARGDPGCMTLDVFTRTRWCPFGPACPITLALRPFFRMHVPDCARLGLYALKKPGCTPLGKYLCPFWSLFWACMPSKHACIFLSMSLRPPFCSSFGHVRLANLADYARGRSSQVGPLRLENLAVLPCTCVYIPFGAHLGLYAEETWLYVPGRVFFMPI